jgi:hypothetical protein
MCSCPSIFFFFIFRSGRHPKKDVGIMGFKKTMHAPLFIVIISCVAVVHSFGFSTRLIESTRAQSVALQAAGMGMSVAPKKKGKKKNAPFDVNASLMRLEKLYDEISLANAKAIQSDDDIGHDDIVTTEYVIAARSAKGSDTKSIADWVPVAQMCVARPLRDAESSEGVADDSVQAVVSHYCREIFHAATLGSPMFRSLPRNEIQYSVETLDSFHKHVYEAVVDNKKESDKIEGERMSKVEARVVLKLDDDDVNDTSVIKRAYRGLSFELHPDRLVGTDKSQEEVQSASEEYARVKLAYETLSSGVRKKEGSWYESLGGRARTDFRPISLMPLDKAKEYMSRVKMQSAIVGLDREMVQTFVIRNQAASS